MNHLTLHQVFPSQALDNWGISILNWAERGIHNILEYIPTLFVKERLIGGWDFVKGNGRSNPSALEPSFSWNRCRTENKSLEGCCQCCQNVGGLKATSSVLSNAKFIFCTLAISLPIRSLVRRCSKQSYRCLWPGPSTSCSPCLACSVVQGATGTRPDSKNVYKRSKLQKFVFDCGFIFYRRPPRQIQKDSKGRVFMILHPRSAVLS